MSIDTTRARQHLRAFDLTSLFVEELGWDRLRQGQTVDVGGRRFELRPVAEKRGVQVFRCALGADGKLPDYATRRKIEQRLAKLAFEHLVVYVDGGQRTQIWQWVKREPGRPTACREHVYHAGQSGESLLQQLERITFPLSAEEGLTIGGVTVALRDAFDKDRVTKRFYDRFKDEHAAFLGFVAGIRERGDAEWYASLMLNRLMFVYFIQKKGFLDGDQDYLRNRLRRMRERQGEGRFLSFYRHFLLRLFHEGLGRPDADRADDLDDLLGTVPYLNGGLFDVHELEREYPDIQIPDEAFEALFDFFDGYTWHLDERPLRDGREINPDVLGYIFEKYVNQKQMGAYYTKEDITGYISKNTIVPYLFDAARKDCAIAFRPEGALWRLLRDDPDRYVYPAVRKGVIDEGGEVIPLPEEIAAGLDDVTKRGGWNRPADAAYALSTETWREHVARRTRCLELRAKLAAGEVHEINDLITHNLDIVQFAQDAIEGCEGPELLRAFFKAIREVTVLDPTCGSGAFLFAALNILDPLYDASLDRMQAFVADLDHSDEPHSPRKFSDFRETLAEVGKHPNRPYFVLKSIVLNNLYGVDIMEEAVEICKLRLFLKLVAQVERADQIEPLPDIDFNIRAGNTLVGFARRAEVRASLLVDKDVQHRMLSENDKEVIRRIDENAEIAHRAFKVYQEMQLNHGMGGGSFAAAKTELRERVSDLEEELNRHMAAQYGIGLDWPNTFAEWQERHLPFHWFIEFYGIMERGGFDIIVGNPPYIAASKIRTQYTLHGYETIRCSDVYANVLERCANLLRMGGRTGMIVPLSLTFSGDFDALRRLLYRRYATNWFSSFARIPSALFSAEVRVRNTIHLAHKANDQPTAVQMSTVLHRWFEEARPHLFAKLSYASVRPTAFAQLVPKVGSPDFASSMEQTLLKTRKSVGSFLVPYTTKYALHFKKTAYNWLCFCREQPPSYGKDGGLIPQSKFGTVFFKDAETRDRALLLLNGKIMFTFWAIVGDDFDLTRWMFADFPIDFASIPMEERRRLLQLVGPLESLMQANLVFKLNAGKRVGNYNLARCRAITDQSDAILARHLGLHNEWDEIELMYSQIVRTDFDEDEAA